MDDIFVDIKTLSEDNNQEHKCIVLCQIIQSMICENKCTLHLYETVKKYKRFFDDSIINKHLSCNDYLNRCKGDSIKHAIDIVCLFRDINYVDDKGMSLLNYCVHYLNLLGVSYCLDYGAAKYNEKSRYCNYMSLIYREDSNIVAKNLINVLMTADVYMSHKLFKQICESLMFKDIQTLNKLLKQKKYLNLNLKTSSNNHLISMIEDLFILKLLLDNGMFITNNDVVKVVNILKPNILHYLIIHYDVEIDINNMKTNDVNYMTVYNAQKEKKHMYVSKMDNIMNSTATELLKECVEYVI